MCDLWQRLHLLSDVHCKLNGDKYARQVLTASFISGNIAKKKRIKNFKKLLQSTLYVWFIAMIRVLEYSQSIENLATCPCKNFNAGVNADINHTPIKKEYDILPAGLFPSSAMSITRYINKYEQEPIFCNTF